MNLSLGSFPRSPALLLGIALPFAAQIYAQTAPSAAQTDPADSSTTLRINSRAVLVDVVVTDHNGQPVTGLKKEDFKIKEQGKPQSLAYLEEHRGLTAEMANQIRVPSMPLDSFTNYTPIATPPTVNILLLDALNTPPTDQMYLRQSAEHYLRTLKPGTRMAIFTLSLRLHFVEGFSDDPATLAAALGYRTNNRPDPAVLVPSLEETSAQSELVGIMNEQVGAGAGATTSAGPAAMIQSFESFMKETEYAQTSDREYRTSQALQQLATYLESVPGRKNLIWMTGAFPLNLFGISDMRFDDKVRTTLNLLSASRVALYPVDVRGTWTYTLHSAENHMDHTVATQQQMIGPAQGFPPSTADPSTINSGHDSVTTTSGNLSEALIEQGSANNSSNAAMDMVAQQTGGKAFFNGNDLGGIINKVVSSSANFYTLSYTPTDGNMNGAFRKIDIAVNGQKYTLAYRRGYFAREEGRPGAAQIALSRALQEAALAGADPLKPFMDFGLPQSDQILYTERIVPVSGAAVKGGDHEKGSYKVDLRVDLKDLNLQLDSDGLHKGTLNLCLIVYDQFGQIASRRDHRLELAVKPDAWAVFEKTGLQLHSEVEVPGGEFWLRSGIYDPSTQKVGTMQVAFRAVRPLQASGGIPPRQ